MTFVRWYYRDGIYVRSHYRRRHRSWNAQTVLPWFAELPQPTVDQSPHRA
jgi:hypothetical protein